MSLIRKACNEGFDVRSLMVWPGPDRTEVLPAVREFLILDRWDDGSSRAQGTLIFFVDSGMVKVLLNDKDSGRVAVLSAKSVMEALESAEEGLVTDGLDWRVGKGPQGRGPSKK